VPGGISMGLLAESEFDVPLDFEALRPTGCLGLGTAAVTVLDETMPIIDYLAICARFFAHESCGQCTPCREGTNWLNKTIHRIKNGGGRLEDLDILEQLSQNMGITPGTTICGLADGAAWPVKNALAKFRGELEAYIRTHQNPAFLPTPLQTAIAQGVPTGPIYDLPIPMRPGQLQAPAARPAPSSLPALTASS